MREEKIIVDILKKADDWDSLKKELERFNTVESSETKKSTQAGKLFEFFAKYYFLTEPTQKINYKNVWLYNEVPPSILDRLKLPHKDYGIDLILQDNHDKFAAVQCKFKNDETLELNWTKDKLGNAFGLAKNCDRLIIFTNAISVTNVAKKLTSSYEQICYDSLSEISPETFNDIVDVANGNSPKPHQKKKPKEHQVKAIDAVINHLKENDRCQLILPCGAGKTLTALWIKEEIRATKTLVLVPSLALLRQIKNDWNAQRNIEFDYVCVCSEKDIDNEKEDAIEVKPYEIGGPLETKPKDLASYLKQEVNTVVFSTYQSIELVSKATKLIHNWEFDLIICDEAHRTFGSAAKNTFTTVHNNKKVPSKKRIYMTATPKVASKSLKSKLGQDYELLCDMGQEDIFGREAFRMSFAEAIDKGILCQYKIIGVGVSDKEVKKFIDNRQYTGEATATDIAHNFALNHVMEKYNAFHALSFHSRVKWAKEFSERHSKFFHTVFTRHLEGKDPTAFRNKVLKEFRNSATGVVSNARCLSEGVDVPTIDLIYFCDPKTSKIDIVQSAGRALRIDPSGKKKEGFIVVPLFHHIDEDIEKELSKNEVFNHLVSVIRSLCEHDERLMAEINGIATGKGKKSTKRIEITSVGEEDERIIKIEGFENKVKKSLFTEIIDRTKDNWEIYFEKFKEYLAKEGTPYMSRIRGENKELGRWCAWQRTNKDKGTLASDKVRRLTEAGFSWAPSDEKWENRFNEYRQFTKLSGKYSFTESDRLEYPQFQKLFYWCRIQKILYNRNSKKYPSGRYELLTQCGFNFQIDSDEDQTKWLEMFEKLKAFKAQYHHCNVSQTSKDPELKKLGKWLNTQRTMFKGRVSAEGNFIKMPEDRIKMLEDLGVVWNAKDADWEKGFQELKLFKELNGHFNIPQNEKLYYRARRLRLKKHLLTREQLAKLDSIGFYQEYEIQKTNNAYPERVFLKRFEELKRFKDAFGTINIDYRNKKYSGLYHWKKDIRKNKERLTESQKERLKSIGFDVEVNFEEQKFNQRIIELKKYFEKYGTYIISEKHKDFSDLHYWVNYIRAGKRQLSEEQRKQLTDIGFFNEEFRKLSTTSFDERIEQLKAFKEKFGTYFISEKNKEYKSLYHWKRGLNKDRPLTSEETNKLNDIGFSDPKNNERLVKTITFEKRLEELKAYKDKYGTLYIHSRNPEFQSLYNWKKQIIHSKILNEKQRGQLRELGVFDKHPTQRIVANKDFDIRYKELQDYKDKFGTTHISRTNKEYKKLYNWVHHVKRRAKLTTKQIELLMTIGINVKKTKESE
jgi:superfamily II DNA or RNA helicase